jgi:type II restriction enzyme
MNLNIDVGIEGRYKGASQKTRLLTERWTLQNVRCPRCGGVPEKYPNNKPVADFECRVCTEDFELKSTSSSIGKSVPDGAYATMMERLGSNRNPSLLILQYDPSEWFVKNLLAIPKYYFTPKIVRKRIPLALTARRAGWVGCNILVGEIPKAGRISLVIESIPQPLNRIIAVWEQTAFLEEARSKQTKSWLTKTMLCIDRLRKRRFDLKELYGFESELQESFPENRYIREKLRQQVQVLRDRNYLRFLGEGKYELNSINQFQPNFPDD